jgi:GNAT superfamily N-acetyltransferase
MKIQRRRAIAQDVTFLEDVHVAALGPLVLVGYGWPAFRLRDQFHREIEVTNCHVILVDGVGAGYLSISLVARAVSDAPPPFPPSTRPRPPRSSISDKGEFWYIDAIAIAPKYQRKGVGSAVLRSVLDEAGRVPVRLNVLHINRAKALYERLGFRTILEDKRRQIMEWCPSPGGAPTRT